MIKSPLLTTHSLAPLTNIIRQQQWQRQSDLPSTLGRVDDQGVDLQAVQPTKLLIQYVYDVSMYVCMILYVYELLSFVI